MHISNTKIFQVFLTKRGNHRIYNTHKQNATALIIVTEVKANLDKIRHWLKSSERGFLKIKFIKISFYLSENHIPVCPLTLSQDSLLLQAFSYSIPSPSDRWNMTFFFFTYFFYPKVLKKPFRAMAIYHACTMCPTFPENTDDINGRIQVNSVFCVVYCLCAYNISNNPPKI